MNIAENLIKIIILTLVLAGIIYNLWERYREKISERHCPNCHKDNAAQIIKEEFAGVFRKNRNEFGFGLRFIRGLPGSTNSNVFVTAWYEKYKVHNKCKFCGHEWVSHKLRMQ